MRLRLHFTYFALTFFSSVRAQPNGTSTNEANMAEVTTGIDITKTNARTDECDSWIGTLFASDLDSSNGLSESEYHTFLSSIKDPPHVVEYFRDVPSFNRLSWVLRAVHKLLACHCQNVGLGAGCCTGDDAEIMLSGLGDSLKTDGTMTDVDEEYIDFFCHQIAYALTMTISSPKQTTPKPSVTLGSSTPSPAGGASGPLPSVSLKPTIDASVNAISNIVVEEGTSYQGVGTGGMIGIVVAILLLYISIITLVTYHHKIKRARPTMLDEGNVVEMDIEAAPQIVNKTSEVILVHEQNSEDEGFAPQVLPESNADVDEIPSLIASVERDLQISSSYFESGVSHHASEPDVQFPSYLDSDLSYLVSETDSHAPPSNLESVLSNFGSEPDSQSLIRSSLSYMDSESDSLAPSYLESGLSNLESELDPESDNEEEEEGESDESDESSEWSDSDAGENDAKSDYCSTLAALGVASTVTANFMAPTPKENS